VGEGCRGGQASSCGSPFGPRSASSAVESGEGAEEVRLEGVHDEPEVAELVAPDPAAPELVAEDDAEELELDARPPEASFSSVIPDADTPGVKSAVAVGPASRRVVDSEPRASTRVVATRA
jgi:hypothetical protein